MQKPAYVEIAGGMKATTFAGITGKMPIRKNSKALGELTPVGQGKPLAGRNQPCPCGSGKKYKACHLREVQAVAQLGS